jgi:hypothetical protein
MTPAISIVLYSESYKRRFCKAPAVPPTLHTGEPCYTARIPNCKQTCLIFARTAEELITWSAHVVMSRKVVSYRVCTYYSGRVIDKMTSTQFSHFNVFPPSLSPHTTVTTSSRSSGGPQDTVALCQVELEGLRAHEAIECPQAQD